MNSAKNGSARIFFTARKEFSSSMWKVYCRLDRKRSSSLFWTVLIISIVYSVCAIQPPIIDEWSKLRLSFPSFPETGQEMRYAFGHALLCRNVFSLFKPAILLTSFFMTVLIWKSLSNEITPYRFGLTLLAILGFPYVGHVITTNLGASEYGVSAIWVFLWYLTFKTANKRKNILWWILLFAVSFFTSTWHEVWLVSFSVVTIYLLVQSFYFKADHTQFTTLRSEQIVSVIVAFAYVLAVFYYTRGGPEIFIDKRLNRINHLGTLSNWQHIISAIIVGTKENLVLFKDCTPVFLLIVYAKLNTAFRAGLEKDVKLFTSMVVGVLVFTYVVCLLNIAIQWRTRWLSACILSVSFFSFPNSILIDLIRRLRIIPVKIIRQSFLLVLIAWFSYNIYFTYYFNNVDVVGWLQFRRMVVKHDPRTLEELCCRTLPGNRPKGVAWWSHVWGAQDDRYRYFMAPTIEPVREVIKSYWDAR